MAKQYRRTGPGRTVPGVSYTRRLISARRSAAAYARFGHNRPSERDFASRWGISTSDARRILEAEFGRGAGGEDRIVPRSPEERARNSGLKPSGVPGRLPFGFGNLFF